MDIEEKTGDRVGGAGGEDVEVLKNKMDRINNESIRWTTLLDVVPERPDFNSLDISGGEYIGRRRLKVEPTGDVRVA